jgi:hypothetical protein
MGIWLDREEPEGFERAVCLFTEVFLVSPSEPVAEPSPKVVAEA